MIRGAARAPERAEGALTPSSRPSRGYPVAESPVCGTMERAREHVSRQAWTAGSRRASGQRDAAGGPLRTSDAPASTRRVSAACGPAELGPPVATGGPFGARKTKS